MTFSNIGIAACVLVTTLQTFSSARFTDSCREAWVWLEDETAMLRQGARTVFNRVISGPLWSLLLKTANVAYRLRDVPGFVRRQNQSIREEIVYLEEKLFENINDLYQFAMDSYNCTCKLYQCGCCGHVTEHWILTLNATACFKLSYVAEDYGLAVVVTLNGHTIFRETVSGLPCRGNEIDVGGKCLCINYDCGCCAHLEDDDIHLNSTICANATYLSEDIGISLTITVNKYTIYNETVSVRNPPPVCLGVPYVEELAEACVRIYNIDATTSRLHACARVEARMKKVLIAKYKLGCFTLGPQVESKHNVVADEPKDLVVLVK